MPTSISLLLFLTCAPHPLSSTPTTHNRRTLHQSFFPQDSIPPSQPPNTTLKLPFSTTPTTATPSPSSDQQPFFPSFPSPPPPPLPPSPPSPFANISSLSLPTPSNPNLTPPSSSRPFSPPLSSSSSSSSSTSARKNNTPISVHRRQK